MLKIRPPPTLPTPSPSDPVFKVLFFVVLFILVVTFAVLGYWIYRSGRNTEAVIPTTDGPSSPTPQLPSLDLERAPLLEYSHPGYSHPGYSHPGYLQHPTHHNWPSYMPSTAVSSSRMPLYDHSLGPESYHPNIQYPRVPYIGNGAQPRVTYVPVLSPSHPFVSSYNDEGDPTNVTKL